jgi:molecular chaperone GrpE (heat shock protein)
VTDAAEVVETDDDFDGFEDSDLADWKQSLRTAFETWLARITDIPEPEETDTPSAEPPDLYSFYQQLAAANAENRKANRRTAEAISQWGETLLRFENSLAPLRESAEALAAAQPGEDQLSHAHCQVLVELLDRMRRIGQAFDAPPPKKTWWGGADAAWRKQWETQRQGFSILVSHLEGLLEAEGVTRIPALGQPFDPTLMAAVATETDASRPAQTVIEEVAAGYRLHGELLRPAQVKVSRLP